MRKAGMNDKKTVSFGMALAIIFLPILVILLGGLVLRVGFLVPLMLATITASLLSIMAGFTWKEVEACIVNGVHRIIIVTCILFLVGTLIGVWIQAGVIPLFLYWGLKLLSPSMFLVSTVLICAVFSLMTGTSFGTIGTAGLALLGVGEALGFPTGLTAGAIVSGAYFGDKMSPLSYTTNLAPAMAGTDVMTHVKAMILPTGITYVVTLIGFGILGAMQYHGGDADMSRVTEFSGALEAVFNINPALLLPPVIVIVAVAMKMPAIPGITLGIISGAIMGMIFQPECNMGTVFDFGMNGYYFSDEVLAMFEETLSPETSYTMTRLLESGGILGMMSSVAMTIIAMMFGGIMEDTHQLEVIVNSLKKLAKGPAGLVLLTECTCVLSNAVMPEQYISIVVPGRMYAEEYREKGLHPALLSGTLESAGTVTSALIPWNTCGVFISSTLDINAWGAGGYGPWALFNWLMPLINWLCALIGWTVKDLAGKPYKKSKAAAKAE